MKRKLAANAAAAAAFVFACLLFPFRPAGERESPRVVYVAVKREVLKPIKQPRALATQPLGRANVDLTADGADTAVMGDIIFPSVHIEPGFEELPQDERETVLAQVRQMSRKIIR